MDNYKFNRSWNVVLYGSIDIAYDYYITEEMHLDRTCKVCRKCVKKNPLKRHTRVFTYLDDLNNYRPHDIKGFLFELECEQAYYEHGREE